MMDDKQDKHLLLRQDGSWDCYGEVGKPDRGSSKGAIIIIVIIFVLGFMVGALSVLWL